jgi:hypothetical protein
MLTVYGLKHSTTITDTINLLNKKRSAPTKLVQHSVQRGSSHRCYVASSKKFNMVWQYRSPIAVGREGVFLLPKLFLPAFAAATGGEGGRQQAVGIANNYIANRKKAAFVVKTIFTGTVS